MPFPPPPPPPPPPVRLEALRAAEGTRAMYEAVYHAERRHRLVISSPPGACLLQRRGLRRKSRMT